jgi:hypothetical protein
MRVVPRPSSVSDLAELGVAYVQFALTRPAVFRLMFGNACDDSSDQRVRATAEVRDLVSAAAASVFPEADMPALATAGWSLVTGHWSLVRGLAFLHLDGKASEVTGELLWERSHKPLCQVHVKTARLLRCGQCLPARARASSACAARVATRSAAGGRSVMRSTASLAHTGNGGISPRATSSQ